MIKLEAFAHSGEAVVAATWRGRPRHRELSFQVADNGVIRKFRPGRRNQRASRVRSPE
jgi:hypothetical protein